MIRSLSRLRSACVRAAHRGSERGATMVEYALLLSFVAMVALAGVKTLGTTVRAAFIAFAGAI